MFRFEVVPEGAHILLVEHLAYGDQSREIAVNPGEDLRLDVRLAPRTIELEPLVVEAVTELERRRISTGHSINEVGPAQLSEAARRGLGSVRCARAAPAGPQGAIRQNRLLRRIPLDLGSGRL